MTGNKTVDTIIIGLLTLASLGTLGVFVYTVMLYERPLPNNERLQEELISDSKASTQIDSYKMDKMIINLKSRQSRLRFLDVELHLRPFKSEYTENFDKNKAFIHDSIIDIAGHMDPAELNSLHGKVLLEHRIKTRLNSYFGKSMVKDIFFSKFVVQ